ncbi:MAG TPA: ABC transporter permease [Iamia sp.]|nr:ABC transporter permease [Iamia sp.]
MFKVALKNILGHKLRTLFTALAIALGVGFMAGTFVLTDTMQKAFDELFSDIGADIDAVVQGKAPFEADTQQGDTARPDIDAALVDDVRQVEGVAEAEPVVFTLAWVLDADGDTIAQGGAPSFGTNWTGVPEIDVFTIEEGEPPTGATGAVLDEATVDKAGFAVGDQFQVQTTSGVVDLTLQGVVTFGETGSLAGASIVALDTPAALDLFSTSGKVQNISVVGDDGVSQQQLVDRIADVLPDTAEVITGEQSIDDQTESIQEGIGIFRQVLTYIGLISLIAGAFLIYNTFGIIIGQRLRELALLRALGSSRRQVLTSVLGESVITGVLASLLGLVGGIALAYGMLALLSAFGLELPDTLPVVTPRTIITSLVVGVGITVFSSLAPAIRGSRIPPIAALREQAVESPGRSTVRLVVGVVLTLIGVGSMVAGATSGEVAPAASGMIGLFAGVIVLGPFLVPVLVGVLGFPLRVLGLPGALGRDNSRRNPKRSASTAAALMLAVTIITFIAVSTLSFTSAFNSSTDKLLLADLEITSGFVPTLGPALVDTLAEQPEVGAVTGVQQGSIEIEGTVRNVYGVRPSTVEQIFDLDGVEGDLAGMGSDGIAIDRETADDDALGIGDELAVTLPDGTEQTMAVAAIYEDGGIVAQNSDGHYLVSEEVFRDHFPESAQTLNRVDVKAADGVSPEELRTVVEGAAEDFPSAEVRDKEQIKEANNNQLLVTLGFLFVLLGLALVIGALGVAITLALSVFERTREIGLLRSVGATRSQLAVSITAESLLLAALGTVLGLAIGIAGAAAVVQSQSDLIPSLSVRVPIWFVIVVFVVANLIGLVASLIPGWRAARMDVLKAVTHE